MTDQSTNVLIVEDNVADRSLVHISLAESPDSFKLVCAERLDEGLEKLGSEVPDVVLLDLNLPDSQGGETVRRMVREAPQVPILVLTGADDDCLAIDAVRAGAQDYIVKGRIDSQLLTRAMRYAIERHRLLMALQESREKQLEFKDQFLSHVSHELRSPLTCIHQYAEVILDGLAGPLTGKERRYLENVLRSAKQLNGLINDLLDAARANVGKLSIEPARVQPSRIVEHLLQIFEAKSKVRGIALGGKIEPDLPPVLADPSRLEQILVNLLENALKFTEPGGQITISASVFADDPRFIKFSVADTGIGINEQNLERIFDRLYQEQSAVFNKKGLGLGLAISKDLVENHGGQIWVESKPGRGSVFSLTFPIFSLPEIIAPLWVGHAAPHPATVVAVEIARRQKAVGADIWEHARRRCRELVERCILPDKDVLLPAMHDFERREVLLILARADAQGAGILEARVRGQLALTPEIANNCIFRTSLLALPDLLPGVIDVPQQLEWTSKHIEKAVLQAYGA